MYKYNVEMPKESDVACELKGSFCWQDMYTSCRDA